jgi:hypothetical protein
METDAQMLLKKLEKEAEEKLRVARTTPTPAPVEQAILNILQDGTNEFKQKMGRNMTYSEMRQAYG